MTHSAVPNTATEAPRETTGRRLAFTASVLLVETLRGTTFLLGSFQCVVAFALAVLVDIPTAGWGDALNFVLSSVVVLGPLSAGAAALDVADLRRRELLTLADTTPGGRTRALGLPLAALGLWQLLALGVTLLAVSRRVDLSGAFDLRMLSLPSSAVMLMTTCLTVGAAFGMRLPVRAAPPVAMLVTFAGLFVLAVQTGRAAVVSPVFSGVAYQTFYAPNVRLIAGHIALEATVIVVAATSIVRHRRWMRLLPTAAVPAIVAMGLIGSADPAPLVLRHIDQGRCAERDHVSLCIWPEDQEILEPGLNALVRARAAAAPFVGTPTRFAQPGVDGSTVDADGAVLPRRVEYTAPLVSMDDTLSRAVRATLPPLRCRSQAATGAWLDVVDLVELRAGSTYAYPESLKALVEGPIDDQQAWAARRLNAAASCLR